MIFSPANKIAHVLWFEIKNHAKNIELSEFVVMPNYVHAILMLNENGDGDAVDRNDLETRHDLETTHAFSLPQPNNKSNTGRNLFQNQGKNTISFIVGPCKFAVTRFCNQL